MRAYPGFPWLDAADPDGVRAYLERRGWLSPGEPVRACERAGEGNMNLTLRVRTDRRSFIVKQARPWVEKYDHIAAPWERGESERWFYERVALIPEVAAHMPRLLAADGDGRVLLLEDLERAHDLTAAYAGAALEPDEIDQLGRVLRALHEGTASDTPRPSFNRAMRELNHQHCFIVPFDPANGLPLDRFEPGFIGVAASLASAAALRDVCAELGGGSVRAERP